VFLVAQATLLAQQMELPVDIQDLEPLLHLQLWALQPLAILIEYN
jgi:hypothetical protein